MHDSHAAFASVSGFGQETVDFLVGLVPVQAVQVGVCLDAPTPATQVAEYAAGESWAQERVGGVDRQQVVDRQIGMERFGDHRRFVKFTLAGAGARLGRFMDDTAHSRERGGSGDGGVKRGQILRVRRVGQNGVGLGREREAGRTFHGSRA